MHFTFSDGPQLAKVDLANFNGYKLIQSSTSQFTSARRELLSKLRKSLENRFEDSCNGGIAEATKVVNFIVWPNENSPGFGDEYITKLKNHFEKPLVAAKVSLEDCELEWDLLKSTIYSQ